MAVLIVARDCDPHPRVPVSRAPPYTFADADFPAMVAGDDATSQELNTYMVKRTWVAVVKDGALPVEATILETVVTKSRDTTTDRLRSSDVSGSALKFFKFMQLPKELRLLIWREAIANEEYTRPDGITLRYLSSTIDIRDYVKIADDPLIPKFLPRICDVSEETREETIAVLIEGSKFMIASLRDNTFLQTFFKPKGMTGRLELCRDLSFDFFSRFPNGYEKNADLELAVACTSLKTIKLTFHHEPLTRYVLEGDYDEGLTRYPRSADQVFEQFKLRRLLDCKCLKTIIIEHTSYYIPAAVEAAEKLGDLLKLKFSQLEPSQDVAVCYGRQAPRPRRRYPYH